jgi:uncharacterized protein (DUF736 family)
LANKINKSQKQENKEKMEKQREKSIGGLWKKTSKAGKNYIWGKLECNGKTQEFVGFKNERKQPGEKTPDFRLFVASKSASSVKKAEPKSEEVL